MFSNPTQTSGEFYESHSRDKAALYKQIVISSEETPNAIEGRIVIPGLASRAWIEQKREEWGEESGLYKVRVKGEFAGDAAGYEAWKAWNGYTRKRQGVEEEIVGFDVLVLGPARRWLATERDVEAWIAAHPDNSRAAELVGGAS